MPPVAAVRIKVDTPSLLEHAHREGHGFEVVPFVIVKSALEHDQPALRRACPEAPCLHARRRSCAEMGNLVVRDDRGLGDPVGQLVQARAENDGEPRRLRRGGPEDRGGLFGSGKADQATAKRGAS